MQMYYLLLISRTSHTRGLQSMFSPFPNRRAALDAHGKNSLKLTI